MKETYTIAIPMAGLGTRMRPQTWSKPKPLIHLAGRTVLDYVLDQFSSLPRFSDAQFVLILGPNQEEQVDEYIRTHHAEKKISYVIQEEMRGQSDALYLAREYLQGPMLMAFSDTLIETDLSFLDNEEMDGIAWVKAVPDPRRFGVAEVGKDGQIITRLIEKPKDISNNLAVVGFYYFRDGSALMNAIAEQIEKDVSLNGEYFLVDAINLLIGKGARMRVQPVDVWMDAGKPEALLETNRYLLEHEHNNDELAGKTRRHPSTSAGIHPPGSRVEGLCDRTVCIHRQGSHHPTFGAAQQHRGTRRAHLQHGAGKFPDRPQRRHQGSPRDHEYRR